MLGILCFVVFKNIVWVSYFVDESCEDVSVNSITWSHCGRMIVTGNEDTTVRVWNVRTLECIHVLKGHTGPLYAVTVSPTNKKYNEVMLSIFILDQKKVLPSPILDNIKSFLMLAMMITSAGGDKTIRVWKFQALKNLDK